MPRLSLLSPDGRCVQELPLSGPQATIGREPGNDVVINHDSVSRRHARLVVTGRGVTVVDEGSANGLWVRNRRVSTADLRPGDVFAIGECYLRVEGDADPDVPPPAARGGGSCLWAFAFVLMAVGAGCAGGLVVYFLRASWMPLVGGAHAPVAATPCPPSAARLCPWALPGATARECPPGFCFDGGPQGTDSCKQQTTVAHSHRDDSMDVACDDGYSPVVDRCSNGVERCTKP